VNQGGAIHWDDRTSWEPDLGTLLDNFTTEIQLTAGGMTLSGSTAVSVLVGARMRALGMPSDASYCRLTGSGAIFGAKWADYTVNGEGDYREGTLDLWRVEVGHPVAPGALIVAERSGSAAVLGIERLTPSELDTLVKGRYVIGQVRKALGRPPGITTIVSDEEIAGPIREMRAKGHRVTMPTVVAWAGTFTIAELRGYLRVTKRRWTEFLNTL